MMSSSAQACCRNAQVSGSLSFGIGQRIVRRSSLMQISISVSKSSCPRSVAMSRTTRPLRPSFASL